jgi:N6-adenosine-specific RNA methylase IME4
MDDETTAPIHCPDALAPIELRPTSALRTHPQAGLVPEVSADAYRSFRANIERAGLQEPLQVTAAGVVLDGHLRLRAASELGLEQLPVRVVAPTDELEYMVRAALARRHLSASQRAALAVDLADYRSARSEAAERRLANLKGQAPEVATLPPRGKTRDRAAAWVGVSARTIQDAATVKAADPELFEQIRRGALPAERAARQIRQRQRDDALPAPPPLPEGPFELIYADPPWRLAGSPDSSRAVENHYPTMPVEEIAAISIPAAEDALLYLWAVNSQLPEALDVLRAWGFSYVTHFTWPKDKWGLGQYNRCQHELLLLGRRGKFPPPAEARRPSSVIKGPRGRHSAKPEAAYELIERSYPRASKLELFARGTARPGWVGWGNEAAGGEAAT